VTKSITQPGTYSSGMPFMPHAQYLRNAVHLRHLDELAAKIKGDKAGDDRE
jgi:UDP-3-O-[3-hydroxymyristoyl] glucosamine N-acyltransferase